MMRNQNWVMNNHKQKLKIRIDVVNGEMSSFYRQHLNYAMDWLHLGEHTKPPGYKYMGWEGAEKSKLMTLPEKWYMLQQRQRFNYIIATYEIWSF